MKTVRLTPLKAPVKATIAVPGSKSYTNRALLLAAMTPGKVKLINPLYSDDTRAMIACLQTLGIKIVEHANFLEVIGDVSGVKAAAYDLDVDISGTTMRFMTALCAVLPGRQTLHGGEGLHQRPIGQLVDSLRELGANISYLGKNGYPPLLIDEPGPMTTTIHISGSESSQYLSALLMVAPLLNKLTIKLTTSLISSPYVEMTLETMAKFGVKVEKDGQSYHIKEKSSYKADTYEVEGDASSAAYFAAIAALTDSTLQLTNLNYRSKQADIQFLKILKNMGNQITYDQASVTITGKTIKPLTVNMQNCPDQAQTLAVLAAFAAGKTTISDIQSLRLKETERVKALQQELAKMRIKTEANPNTLVIYGAEPQPAQITTYGDHRMAMSFAVAGTKLANVEIKQPDVVSKTFPDFWTKLATIGVGVEYLERNIVLIGMRGSGKTTVAQQLAKRLELELVDLDTVMTTRLKMTAPEIVAKHGWDYFRAQEAIIAQEVAQQTGRLISTGGGVVLRSSNIEALKRNGLIIFLKASPQILLRRIQDTSNRPRLTAATTLKQEVEQVLQERQPLYEAAADIIIDTDKLKPSGVVRHIISQLGSENL